MNASDPDPTRTALLSAWQVKPDRNPAFRTEVWRRIERRRATASWPGYLRAHAPLAAGALLATVALAGWTGHVQAREQTRLQREAMAKAYVQALDARAMADDQS